MYRGSGRTFKAYTRTLVQGSLGKLGGAGVGEVV